jgi:hypothetical protein
LLRHDVHHLTHDDVQQERRTHLRDREEKLETNRPAMAEVSKSAPDFVALDGNRGVVL